MPATTGGRPTSGTKRSNYRRPKSRSKPTRAPSTHDVGTTSPTPGSTVGGQKVPKRTKPKSYVRPRIESQPGPMTDKDRKRARRAERRRNAAGDAHSQLKRAKALDKKGRQKNAGPSFGPGRREPQRIVREAGGETRVIPQSRYRRLMKEYKTEQEQREKFLRENPRYRDDRISKRDPSLAPTRVAGLNVDTALADLDRRLFPEGNPGLRVAKAPHEILKATVEDPGGVAEGTARGVKDTITGLPSAAVKAVTDPEEAVNQILDDYKRRYGPLLAGDERTFRERIKKEGVTAEVLDVAGVASVAGKGAGLATRAFRKPKPRPKLRKSGGRAKPQRRSNNIIVSAGQRAQDKARAVKTARAKQRAVRGERIDALDASVREGEVAPIFRRRQQRIAPAQRKSRGVQAMKAEQAREVHRGSSKNLAKLNKRERKGFKYALQLGIRNAETAKRVLKRRRQQILEAREREGTDIPKALARTNDELRVIDEILDAPEKVFTARLAKVVEEERARSIRLGRADPSLAAEQRLARSHAPLGEFLGITRREGEGTAAYVRRVKQEAAKEGLSDPAYFPSQKRPSVRYSDYALGGTKAVAEDKKYTGALFRTGREDTRPQAFTDSLAKNIKRKHNWQTVADNFDENSFAWGRNKPLAKLLDELDARGIDPGSVAFWNPRKYREARGNVERQQLGEEAFGDDVVPPGLTEAVDSAALDAKGLATKGDEFKSTDGWSVIPKAVYDEIHADTRPSGAMARSWDVLKGKQSRMLLGTNPPWLAFQVGSNVLLTGLAKTGPIDALKAQLWWKRLDPEARAAVEPYVGIGPFAMDVQQTKLGASTNKRLVNSYRAFKQTPLARKAGKANPLDLLFRADNAQNNFFRRAVLYSQAKRDTYQRLGRDVGRVAQAQERLKGLLTLGPEKQIAKVVADRDAIEQHAEYVNRMLGDYATYTARERRILGRSVMFYGFLRFSLQFAFWTMPTRHPVITAIAGNLGQLQTEEVRQLLGGDELPFALGRLYLTDDGELKAVDIGRANPAANALTELVSPYDGGIQFVPRRALGMLPPMVATALDMAYGKSAFTNRPLRVKGEHDYAAAEREQSGKEIGLEERGRIAAARFLDLYYPYRLGEALTFDGQPQGDDTLLWDERPTKYKDDEILRSLARERRRQQARGTGERLLEELTPFLPYRSRDVEIAESIRERREPTKPERKESPRNLIERYASGDATPSAPKKPRRSKAQSLIQKYAP